MKKVGIAIAIVLVLLLAVIFAKNLIAKTALSAGIKSMTGLRLSMKSINIGILKTLVDIRELKLYNPSGFPDKLMVDMPELYVDYDLGAFLKRRVHIEQIKLNLKEFVVVINEEGKLNLDTLKYVQAKQEKGITQEKGKKTRMPVFQIDSLDFKVDKVIFKDYSQGTPPKVREFNVNINEHYENINEPYAFANLIVAKALMNTTIGSLANFDLGPVKEEAKEALGEAVQITQEIGKEIAGTAEETVEELADELKNILPFEAED